MVARRLRTQAGKMEQTTFGSTRHGEKSGSKWRNFNLVFDKFTTPATFACWKTRFKTEVCTWSQFPTEAMQWIKEVEMVDSVNDLKSSCSVRGTQTPDF